MDTYILQCVWPITDNSVALRDLKVEAGRDLQRLARQSRARLVGPPVWQTAPAADTPGFTSHTPGRVLIARAPAVPAAPTRQREAA
jgi:hypothetical protein